MARWLFRIIVCLTLGALTTLALAWGAPLLTSRLSSVPKWSNPQLWMDDTYAGHYQSSRSALADHVRYLHIIFTGTAQEKPYYKTNPPPEWAFRLTQAMEGEGPAAGTTWWGVNTLATGWPLRAFRGGVYEPWPMTQPAAPQFNLIPDGKGGMTLRQTTPPGAQPLMVGLYQFGGKAGTSYTLALQPIPKGLALNTALFAAAWGLLALSIGRVRRWQRWRQGCCAACGYDLRGLALVTTCPECGTQAKRRSWVR